MDYSHKIKLNQKIKQIKDSEILNNIYYIIKNDIPDKITQNENGVYFDLNIVSQNCLKEIEKVLDDNNIDTLTESALNMSTYSTEDKVEMIMGKNNGPKLNSHEKNLINKFN